MGQKSLKIQIIPYKGISFLAITQPFFGHSGLEFFMRTQETIIYRLVLTNPGFGPYLPFSIFWALKRGTVWGLKT